MVRRRRSKKSIINTIAILGIALLASLGYLQLGEDTNPAFESMEKVTVTRVIDGDSIVVTGDRRVRLILVDTPESVHPDKSKNSAEGREASAYVKAFLSDQTVYLEKDVSDTDRYGRLLRYVYLEDGTFVNEKIVRDGYGKIATFPPDVKYKDLILEAQRDAEKNNRGLWGK